MLCAEVNASCAKASLLTHPLPGVPAISFWPCGVRLFVHRAQARFYDIHSFREASFLNYNIPELMRLYFQIRHEGNQQVPLHISED
jgi:hypothetical protein